MRYVSKIKWNFMTTPVYTKRPRNVNTFRAAAILYGDWGTSKAYVIGLAFALAGYGSFWFIAAVSLLGVFIGLNYITICKFYPNGGGVYASVRERSEVLALVGAFFLIADYLVTAALSALSSFHYLGVEYPARWAVIAIAIIGVLNFLGPKHTGTLAILISVPTVIVTILLAIFTIPHIPNAIHHIQLPTTNFLDSWHIFVGVIVALSGIEAIANSTGVMNLNRGTTNASPSVTKTSTPAIIMVMIEVCFFTSLFGLALNALPGLEMSHGTVNAPGFPDVRDAMLRYMGEQFVGGIYGPQLGQVAGIAISVAFCALLLSAVNTAIGALTSLMFILSRDREMPRYFQILNRFGVPVLPLFIATVFPIILILFVHDVAGLADLYAVGFVGAIATNLGATSTNYKLQMSKIERYLMLITFIVMALIEVSLFIYKPEARGFALSILTIGLILRSLVKEQLQKPPKKHQLPKPFVSPELRPLQEGGTLCAIKGKCKSLDFAIEECKKHKFPLYLLFIREQKVLTNIDLQRTWLEDSEACEIFDHILETALHNPISLCYAVSDAPAHSIIEIVKEKKVTRVILGSSNRSKLYHFFKGNILNDVSKHLPQDVELLVVYQ
jgi:amino acid transporter